MLQFLLIFLTFLYTLNCMTDNADVIKKPSTSTSVYEPEQIHIGFGLTPDIMTFHWITFDYPIITSSDIRYGTNKNNLNFLKLNGSVNLFTDNGKELKNRTIHVININNLIPYSIYYYQVGDNNLNIWSSIYNFKTLPDSNTLKQSLPFYFLSYGDMGFFNSEPLSSIINETDDIHMILHVGDFAYDFSDMNGDRGDNFMNKIEPIAAKVPYMVCLGNHEQAYNFSHYTERFRNMPSSNGTVWTFNGEAPNNWYYSWNAGIIHFVTISTEIYFDFPWLIDDQYEWLQEDLNIANNNRSEAPWIIVNGHKPFYCDNADGNSTGYTTLRIGIETSNGTFEYGLESLFYQYGVDLYLCGHEHDYERTYDVYEGITYRRTTDMMATTYIITGGGGTQEGHSSFSGEQKFTAFESDTFGYTRFFVYNETHIHLQQVMCDLTQPKENWREVIDDVWLIQNYHGSFANRTNNSNSNSNNNNNNNNENVHKRANENKNHNKYSIQQVKKNKNENEDVIIPYLGKDKDFYHNIDNVYF